MLALAVLLLVLLGWAGGAAQPLDIGVIRDFAEWRANHPQGTGWTILLTHLGGAPALVSMTGLAALWLWWRGHRARAGLLLLTVLGGRLMIETLKLTVNRPRPSIDAHPVVVFSQSFPSGHAGNSMLTFLALALYLLPERLRGRGLAAAVAGSLAIGATRPILGVHWLSDVLAGWLFGAAFVSLIWWAFGARQSAA